MPTIKINEKSKEIKLKRGESNWVTLDSVGSNVSISDAGTINIVDRAFDGLKNPTVVQAIENNFCNKYNIKVGTDIIIDEGNYEDGDVVLVKFKKKFYIAELSEGILTDYKDNTSIATGENTEIVGMIFKKIEKF
jgi:hypothetical protein